MLLRAVLFSAFLATCNACSCVHHMHNNPDFVCRYDVVFRGTPLSEYEERDSPLDHKNPWWHHSEWVYNVRVNEVFKMPGKMRSLSSIKMRTAKQESLCGIRFRLDTEMLFFATIDHKGVLTTGLCDPNLPWAESDESDRDWLTDLVTNYCETGVMNTPPNRPEP